MSTSVEDIVKYGIVAYAMYWIYENVLSAPVVVSSLPATTTGVIVPPTSTMPTVTSTPVVSTDPIPALTASGQSMCSSYGGTWNSNLNICAVNSLFSGSPSSGSLLSKLMTAAGANNNTTMTAAQWSGYMSQIVGQTISASGAGYTLWPSYLPGADSSTGITASAYIQAYISAGLPVPSGISLSGLRGWERRR